MIFGSESGCLGLENQAFGKGGIAKINFCRNWISHDSRVKFSGFSVALGPIFMTFVALKNDLKFDDFQGDSGVIPDPAPLRVEGKLLIPGPTPNHSTVT